MIRNRLRKAGRRITCNRPPKGWWCPSEAHHDGPCPTYPSVLNVRGMYWHWRNTR